MSEQNKQVVLSFIEAMGRGDAAAAAPCITEDAYTLAKGFGKFAEMFKPKFKEILGIDLNTKEIEVKTEAKEK